MTEPLVVQREVAAPPATVLAFLTDPEKILRWIGTETTLEPRPGGPYLLDVVGQKNKPPAVSSPRSYPSTASPTAFAGRGTKRCRRDQA